MQTKKVFIHKIIMFQMVRNSFLEKLRRYKFHSNYNYYVFKLTNINILIIEQILIISITIFEKIIID